MTHKHDWTEPLRRRVVPIIGAFAAAIEDYTGTEYYHDSEQRNRQFVGRIEMDEECFERVLHDNNFHRNVPAWLKRAPDGEVEEGSWRRVDGEMQTHLVFYDGKDAPNARSGQLFLYAHYEYRWDVHPLKHLRGDDIDCDEGVSRVRRLLQDEGIQYDFIQPG